MAGMEADFEIREGGRATVALSVAFRAAPKRELTVRPNGYSKLPA
jgi:hypothetical protein